MLSSRGTDLLFFVDGAQVGNYTSQSDGTAGTYTYNVPFYVNPALQPGEHYFLLQNGQGDGGVQSLVLFDYLVYTM